MLLAEGKKEKWRSREKHTDHKLEKKSLFLPMLLILLGISGSKEMFGIMDTKKTELRRRLENQSTCILIIEHFLSGKI